MRIRTPLFGRRTAPVENVTEPEPQTPQANVWPEGVIARYLTIAGATVDISPLDHPHWLYHGSCTGCLWTDHSQVESYVRSEAQSHAEVCRGLPRPAAA